jgi:PAS domain S-box-containing protein
MNDIDNRLERAIELCRRANAVAEGDDAQLPVAQDSLSPSAARQMLHELRVHQIELEMQNEELRRAQLALDAACSRYFNIYDLAPVGYCTLSEGGLIREANLCAATLLGMSREALVNQSILSLIARDDRDLFYLHHKKLISSGQAQLCELRMTRLDGSSLWVRMESTAARELDGTMVLRVVLSDISASRRAEAVLQASEEQYRCLAEDMPIFVATFDPDGVLTYANEALARSLGMSRGELVGRNMFDFLSADSQIRVRARLAQLTPEHPVDTHEQSHLTMDGMQASNHWTGRAFFDSSGRVVRFQAIGRDITERKTIEAELIAAKQAAEDANLAKSRFLAAASHDLRQPLQAISLFNDALLNTGLSTAQKIISDYLSQAINSLGELLGALLDISKLDAGVVKPCPEIIDLPAFFSLMAAQLSPLAEAKSLRFRVFCPCREMAVSTDRKLLMSLLGNLLGNAIKYTERGGVLLSVRQRGNEAVIQVWDNGIGIAPEHHGNIFEEYFQIHNPERDRTKGLGLGLAIVKRLAKLLGTRVLCHSRPGRGSVFEFRLPLVSPQQEDDSGHFEPSGTTSSLVGRSVVVVEDDLMVAKAIKLTLESVGINVSIYSSAELALLNPEITEADAYVSDFRLPGMSGVQFLDALRLRTSKPFKAVILTGDTSKERIEKTELSGWPVLFKPIDLPRLLAKLESTPPG